MTTGSSEFRPAMFAEPPVFRGRVFSNENQTSSQSSESRLLNFSALRQNSTLENLMNINRSESLLNETD